MERWVVASFGAAGKLTTCPRCKGRNAVVEVMDAYGFSKGCLYCGWYGYADEKGASNGRRTRASHRGAEGERGEEERVAVSAQ